MDILRKRGASRELFDANPTTENAITIQPKLEVEVIEDDRCGFTINPLWYEPAPTLKSPKKKRKATPPSSTKKKRPYRRTAAYGNPHNDGALPENLAEFILEDEQDFQVIPEREYEACLALLMSTMCRKTQVTKVCKLLGVSPRAPIVKRKYTKKSTKSTHGTNAGSLQSTPSGKDTSADNSFLSDDSTAL